MARPALLIIDMQNDFCLPEAPFEVRNAMAVVPHIRKLADAFRAQHLAVIYVIREHARDGSDIELTRLARFREFGGAFIAGTRGHAVVDGLEPQPGEPIVRKKRWSAFHKTDLEDLLRDQQIEVVVIAGVQTPNCIRASAFDANSLDFEVVVASDATGASTADVHRASLRDLLGIGVEVLTADEVIARLPDGLGQGLRRQAGRDATRGATS
jgi:nicotinamidase-related amidase